MKPKVTFDSPSLPAIAREADPPDRVSVFVIEDERLVALDLQKRLDRLGYNVVGVASDAQEAMQKLSTQFPDIVLLDILLPGDIDGIQLAQRLQRESSAAFIYITGNADEYTLRRAQATSPINYIIKPVQDRELRISIEAAIHHLHLNRQIRRAHESVEQRVQERVLEIARINRVLRSQIADHVKLENELRHSRSFADAGCHGRARLYSSFSREFRTPMNGIIGTAEALAETLLTDEQRKLLTTIRACSHSLLGTVDSLVLFAEIEAGCVVPQERPLELRTLCRGIFDHLLEHSTSPGQDFTCDIAPELPEYVVGDAMLLGKAIMKLTTYVLSLPGSVSLHLERIADSGGRAYIHISVRNEGPDLPESIKVSLQRIFASSPAAESQDNDASMDVRVASRLIQLMDGIAWLDTLPGAGSSFNVALWLKTSSIQAQNSF